MSLRKMRFSLEHIQACLSEQRQFSPVQTLLKKDFVSEWI